MKPIVINIGLVGLTLSAALCIGQDGMEKERREKLLAARDAWYAAFYRGDTDAMEKVEAKEFLVIGDAVVRTKEEQLNEIKKAVEDKKWFPEGTAAVAEDLRVRFEGTAAIVTGRGWAKGPERKDAPAMRNALTEVWAVRDGRWTVLHLHFHRLPADEPKK